MEEKEIKALSYQEAMKRASAALAATALGAGRLSAQEISAEIAFAAACVQYATEVRAAAMGLTSQERDALNGLRP